jgi:hypothetical protein
MKKNDIHTVQNFSAVQMKRELQEQFQRKTAGMSFAELRRFLDESLEPLPQEKPTEELQNNAE